METQILLYNVAISFCALLKGYQNFALICNLFDGSQTEKQQPSSYIFFLCTSMAPKTEQKLTKSKISSVKPE